MQAVGAPVIKDGITDVPGRANAVHKAVALRKTVGGVQFLAGGFPAAVQRILQKLVILPLPHILRHILDRGGLVVDQVVDGGRLVVIK